ncbi:hypothetical protein [Halothiobacillus sp. 15-55-196]|jgi:hypothetical protein|uniref:hypothetical protein n=1 Tax=Halothiobacillus sp. 15-55-196 TaxID=1970382 RepID=UPI0025B865FB|nr:hypothetical protein [Halothiobacillus sp. 15-55-196]
MSPNVHNYSENWQHLESILKGYAPRNRRVESYSYRDHIHAKALSIFLTNATLATPRLDRETVEEVLSGKITWPHASGTPQFKGVDLPLSLLEEHGLVSFYANWCSVHYQSVKNLGEVDSSLIPLIQAIEYIQDISYGRNDYIQPYYSIPENGLVALLAEHFGSKPIAELIPEIQLKNGYFLLPPGNQSFSPLVSTNLWFKLRETLEPQEAFKRWILCFCVNCEWAMPVLFDDSNMAERNEFNDQLVAYLAQDAAFNSSMDILWKQLTNEHGFSRIVSPVSTTIHMMTDQNGGSSHTEHQDNIKNKKLTLNTLSDAYAAQNTDESNDIQMLRQWQQYGSWPKPTQFYTWLLNSAVEASIHIDRQLLTSFGFTEALLELTTSRPILKYMLFNLVPTYDSAAYKILLLSQPSTCDIALFYLTWQSFTNSPQGSHTFTQHFDKGYQQLICLEYLRTIEKEPDSGDRLLKVVEFLGDRCNLNSSDFPKSPAYQFLLCLLDSLNHQRFIHLGQAFVAYLPTITTFKPFSPPSYWYLVGFWLIERLDGTGIDSTGTLSSSLKNTLFDYYKREFEANFAENLTSLQPSDFFFTLPWHKLIQGNGDNPLLKLSSDCDSWQQHLNWSNENCHSVASAIRHYLQILMCVGRPQRLSKDWQCIANRVVDIVRIIGFYKSEQAAYLFSPAPIGNKYDLWSPFCSYTNLLQDCLYDDFVQRCLSRTPLNLLLVLNERCTVIARAEKLQDEIGKRQSSESEDMGLSSIEQAFLSAWNDNKTTLVSQLLVSAKTILDQRFTNIKNAHVLQIRRRWQSYEYKLQLLQLLEGLRNNPDEFKESVNNMPLPGVNSEISNVQWLQQECEHFRRYIIAGAYYETDPKKCVDIMEALCIQSKNSSHSFLLFQGRLALHKGNADAVRLRHALSQFLGSIADTEPEAMPPLWVASILGAYQQLRDTKEIDSFWMKLSLDQKDRLEILHPYCKALIERSEPFIAQQIVNRYLELNQKTSDGLGLNELIDELLKAIPRDQSTSQLIQVVNEGSQRSMTQLAKHYNQIVSKDFVDYVAIVKPEKLPHEFLKDVVLEVAQELLLRKKNLQIHGTDSEGKACAHITKEDLINDWFTSLFDKRMAEARIGFRDQKRGGQSDSGKNPGEIDGFITDSNNKRIALFEAFKLSSIDTNTISQHLNKIAGYDNESLSPIFIIAYCDVSNFSTLVTGYETFIAKQSYSGFNAIDAASDNLVETQLNQDHLWLGMERRYRPNCEIIFYHLLLDMRAY